MQLSVVSGLQTGGAGVAEPPLRVGAATGATGAEVQPPHPAFPLLVYGVEG